MRLHAPRAGRGTGVKPVVRERPLQPSRFADVSSCQYRGQLKRSSPGAMCSRGCVAIVLLLTSSCDLRTAVYSLNAATHGPSRHRTRRRFLLGSAEPLRHDLREIPLYVETEAPREHGARHRLPLPEPRTGRRCRGTPELERSRILRARARRLLSRGALRACRSTIGPSRTNGAWIFLPSRDILFQLRCDRFARSRRPAAPGIGHAARVALRRRDQMPPGIANRPDSESAPCSVGSDHPAHHRGPHVQGAPRP